MNITEILVSFIITVSSGAVGGLIAAIVYNLLTMYRPGKCEKDILQIIDYAEHYFSRDRKAYVARQMDANALPIVVVEQRRDEESHPSSVLCLQPGPVSWEYSSQNCALFGKPRKKPCFSPNRIEISGDYYHAAEKLKNNDYLRIDNDRFYLSYVGREYMDRNRNRNKLRRRGMVERHRLYGTRNWRNMFRGKLWERPRFINHVEARNMVMQRCHPMGRGIRIGRNLRESDVDGFWSEAIEFPVDNAENNPCDVTLLIIDRVDRECVANMVNKDVDLEVEGSIECYFVEDSVLYNSQRLVYANHQDNGISHLWFDGGGTRKPMRGGGYLIVDGCSEEEQLAKEKKIVDLYYNDESERLGGLLRSVGI